MMKVLATAALVLVAVAGIQAHDAPVQVSPGHYLKPFGGVVYASTLQAHVIETPAGLQWRIDVYDRNQVYQGTQVMLWGWPGDLVLPARDYDGDGLDDPAVYRPWTGQTFVRLSNCALGFWACYYILEDH